MKFGKTLAFAAMALSAGTAATPVQARAHYVGEVILVAQKYCPRDTLPADGRLLSIARNQELFILLGTDHGGDGIRTFALTDLRSDAPTGTRYCLVTEGIFPGRT